MIRAGQGLQRDKRRMYCTEATGRRRAWMLAAICVLSTLAIILRLLWRA